MNPDLLPEGLRDRLMPDAEAAALLTQRYLGVLASHGYERVAPPLMEYERSLAFRTDGYAKDRMVRAVDPQSLRTLALRSDMTVQIGRIATTRLADKARPLRLSYAGPVMTLAAGQLRPERERFQIGAELIGRDTVAAAVEIVSLAVEALKAVGLTGITVDFTLPDLVPTLANKAFPLADEAMIAAVERELDTKDAGGLAAIGADAYIPLLYAMGPLDEALAKLNAIDAGGALASRIEALRQIAAPLEDDVTLMLDPSERHGFEYQSWFGFTLYAEGFPSAVGRGGTYAIRSQANSVSHGEDEVATGFSLYPDPLVAAGIGHAQAKRIFLPLGYEPAAAATLRGEGWRTVAALDESDDARALGCAYILGTDGPEKIA
ncbi:ATP phosphoribosyltransferase regulatory subunit [Alterisphingorhabdus coralli]|uniref:ATP phosphoribosyltransferase regulatory subunit n=1 Tax=Alterisphingorhabdus coralli TaxID=3071408 RepID=A0AA97F867_9SPHN|nr:ATP phosphoribosyltransferase regulatory subunit [Parasphingorhabdus sp. SCSIO 66989]WOE76119.1 ATP phosphoribosyltransferase regulatory subunit [Parasphingorhabdus sp. SCSIO 66989]